jgi:hypothetical protein
MSNQSLLSKCTTKEEVLALVKFSLNEDPLHDILSELNCEGRSDEHFPQFESERHFNRCFVFTTQEQVDDEHVGVILAHYGNNHFGYVCESTKGAMTSFIEENVNSDDVFYSPICY